MLYLTQRRTQATLLGATERFGDVFTIRLVGGKKLVFASSPELVEQVFTADPEVLIPEQRGPFLLGKQSVAMLYGPPHTAARELLAPAFDSQHVERYRAGMERICDEEFASWPVKQQFPLFRRMEHITIKVIINAVTGMSSGAEMDTLADRLRELIYFREGNPFVAALINVAPAGTKPPEKFMRVRRAFDDEIYKQIERARQDPNLAERGDVIAVLVRANHPDGSAMSDEEIRDHVATLLVMGHGSPATALAWCIERLLHLPPILDRVLTELQRPNGESGEYLEAVVTETLRLRPPVPVVAREVAKPFELAGYEIPPKTLVAANGIGLHRREDLYPEPLEFRPERWIGQKPGPWTWIPFGGGPRYCLGRNLGMYEIKFVLAKMLREFEFEQTPDAPDELMMRRGIGWIPKDGTPVVIKNRIQAARSTTPVPD
jgi:cytochrome P450